MTMGRTILFMFFCGVVQGDIGNNVFVPERLNWTEAQAYCRQHHTDLSFANSKKDIDKLLKAAGTNFVEGWIGLQQRRDNNSAWKWSGGGNITYTNWRAGEPNLVSQDKGRIWGDGTWYDEHGHQKRPFFCIKVTVVEEKKPWEEALKHCREHHTDLPSVLSETDLLLAQTAIQHSSITEPVWIGLRYLLNRWLWVNGDPLVYEAWPQGRDQDHQCPMWNRCGALTKERRWEGWDCNDNLTFICI